MKIFISLLFLFLIFTNSFASVHVRGYNKKSGKYVMPHYRSCPNSKKYNNYSSKYNVSSHAGEKAINNSNKRKNGHD